MPVHRSLTQPILIGGAPRELAILNGTITAALVLGLQTILALPIGIVLHLFAVAAAKHDPHFLSVFKRHLTQKAYYEA